MTSYTGLFDLAKKVAVVTGGAGFLGKHFCRGLAEAGASVVVVDITATEVSAIVAEINEKHPGKALGAVADVTQPAEVQKITADAVSHFGRIDILLNNAAGKGRDLDQYFAPFEE